MRPSFNDETDFLSLLLLTLGVGGAIFAFAAGALVLFWKSLKDNPGAVAEKGSAGARVNRSFFLRFAILLVIVVLASFAIFWLGSG